MAEHRSERRDASFELRLGPGLIGAGDTILPADVIIGVQANLEPRIAHCTHQRSRVPADMRARQQRAIQQRFPAVVFQHRGAPDLAEETAPKYASQCPPGVVRSDAEVERCSRSQPLQQGSETWNALEGSAQRVDVDFERQPTYALVARAIGRQSAAHFVWDQAASTSARASPRLAR